MRVHGQRGMSKVVGLTEQARLTAELLLVLGLLHLPIFNNIKVMAGEKQETLGG